MLSSGYTVEDMIYNIAEDIEILEKIPLNFRCNCSKDALQEEFYHLVQPKLKK